MLLFLASTVRDEMERSCNICAWRRARWFCASDDAFLCQACDALVHSANALARRHERILLKTASLDTSPDHHLLGDSLPPAWLRGFTARKPRTPRHAKHTSSPHPHEQLLVPDLGPHDAPLDDETEEQEQFLCRVPIYDPAAAGREPKGSLMFPPCRAAGRNVNDDVDYYDEHRTMSFPPASEVELTEFLADMESLLGSGMEQQCYGIEDSMLLDERRGQICYGTESVPLLPSHGIVPKIKDEEDGNGGTTGEKMEANEEDGAKKKKKKILLRLDYPGVMAAWKGQGSPWTGSDKPELDPDDCCWPASCMGLMEVHYGRNYEEHAGGFMSGGHMSGPAARWDVRGREARVSRYKEKRRTRLFSKKIRYEVRKLNAEKRPRMKGRFVKRDISS